MTSIMHSARKALVALASTLAFASAASALEGTATDDPAAGAPAAMLELDEIRVHGKRLATRVEEAEDDFFGLYNSLNDDDRFDVVCGLISLQMGSLIPQRTCLPGFLADHSRLSLPGAVHYSPTAARLQPATCYGSPAMSNGGVHFEGGCYGQPWDNYSWTRPDHSYNPATYGYGGLASRGGASAELQALHFRDQYADSLRSAIAQHPELADKAAHLAGLYTDLQLTQQLYREVKAATPLAWSFQRQKGAPGPRSR